MGAIYGETTVPYKCGANSKTEPYSMRCLYRTDFAQDFPWVSLEYYPL